MLFRSEAEFRLLGISKRYRGYKQALMALELVLADEDCMYNITQRVYRPVADRCSCGRFCIERNIRTISRQAWRSNRARLRQIAGYPLPAPPSASEFLSIMAAYFLREEPPLPHVRTRL